MALMLNLVYKGRALPLGWLIVKAKKGHLAVEYHLQLLRQIKPLIPPQAQVVLVADGEFDGTAFLSGLQSYQWHYVCRTAKNSCDYGSKMSKPALPGWCCSLAL